MFNQWCWLVTTSHSITDHRFFLIVKSLYHHQLQFTKKIPITSIFYLFISRSIEFKHSLIKISGRGVWESQSTWPKLVSLSFSLFQAEFGEKTMVRSERWRKERTCYACPMACHCAHYAFSPSPHMRYFSINNSTKLSSKGTKPTVLSSIGNSGASYNTLVSEVFSFPPSLH